MNNPVYIRSMQGQIDLKRTGRILKAVCLSRGKTVKDIQQYLGLACPQSVYRWYNGQALPTVDHLYAMSRLFRVSMDQLIVGVEPDWFLLGSYQRMKFYYNYFYRVWNPVIELQVK